MDAQQAILELLRQRAAGKSICPSEAARILDPVAWRERMPDVRAAAQELAHAGRVVVTQKGEVVEAAGAKGPLRLRLP